MKRVPATQVEMRGGEKVREGEKRRRRLRSYPTEIAEIACCEIRPRVYAYKQYHSHHSDEHIHANDHPHASASSD